MRETITGNIQALRTVIEVGENMVFPEREEVTHRANDLENKLMLTKDEREESLEELVDLSNQYLVKAKTDLERTKKALVLQDIT